MSTESTNGVKVGSIVIASERGSKRYGRVIEIDDAPKNLHKGNVLVEHYGSEWPGMAWYKGWDVIVLTPEIGDRQREILQAQLEELDAAHKMVTGM